MMAEQEKEAGMGTEQSSGVTDTSPVAFVRPWGSLAAAGPAVLARLVGRDFAFASLFLVDRRCGVLRCAAVYPDCGRLDPFRRVTLGSVFAPGVELPGRAWMRRAPTGSRDLAGDQSLPRGPDAAAAGLISGVAAPILVDGRVVAVIEGYRHAAAVPAPALAGRLIAVARDLAAVLASGEVPAGAPPGADEIDERVRAARLAAVVELGRRALTGVAPEQVAAEAVELAAVTLDADQAAFLELDERGRDFILRAGVGWAPGVVGSTVPGSTQSLAGYAITADAPVTVDVLAAETRFAAHPVLLEHGVVSAVGTVVRGPKGPLGVMTALTGRPRRFEPADIEFLRLTANTLAAAIARAQGDEARRRSDALLRAVVDSTTDAVFVKDLQSRYLMMNVAGARVLGHSPEEIVGLDPADVFPPEVAQEIRAADASVMARREWRSYEESIVTSTGEPRVYLSTKGPYLALDGSVVGIIGISRDITERTRAEDRQRLVAAAVQTLAKDRDEHTAVREVTSLAVPAMADWCVIELIDPSGRIVPAAATHAQDKPRLLEALRQRYPAQPDASGDLAQIVRTARPELYQHTDMPPGAAAGQDAHLELLRRVGFESAVVIPLLACGQWIGAITLAVTGPRRYSRADLAVFEQLADRLALALDTGRLHRDREQVARVLQRCLLPLELPAVQGLELAARFHAAGDGSVPAGVFYDAFALADGCMLVVGDVRGRGADAAADAFRVQHVLRTAPERAPDDLLRALNAELLLRPASTPFCTAALARLRICDGGADVTVVSAGHPAPLLFSATGEVTRLPTRGSPVGVVRQPRLPVEELQLGPADALVLCNDAVADAWRPLDAFGVTRGGAEALAGELAAGAVRARLDGPDDDLVILVARVEPIFT
jgi:PAS domain S-box-containing protein